MSQTGLPPGPAPIVATSALPPETLSPLALGVTAKFLQRDAMELARRIVAQLDTPVQLAADMGLSEDQWTVLRQHPHFLRLMEDARSEANSAAGLADRVRLKAMVVLDQGGILDMAGIINNGSLAVGARVDAFKAIADVAGITKQKDQQASQVGAGPLVQIFMPQAPDQPVNIGGRVIEGEVSSDA